MDVGGVWIRMLYVDERAMEEWMWMDLVVDEVSVSFRKSHLFWQNSTRFSGKIPQNLLTPTKKNPTQP